jgi:hypothetical protein
LQADNQPCPNCPGITETAVRELAKSLSGISEIRRRPSMLRKIGKQRLVLLIQQASEGLEAIARPAIYGGQWRLLDRKWLGLLKDRFSV